MIPYKVKEDLKLKIINAFQFSGITETTYFHEYRKGKILDMALLDSIDYHSSSLLISIIETICKYYPITIITGGIGSGKHVLARGLNDYDKKRYFIVMQRFNILSLKVKDLLLENLKKFENESRFINIEEITSEVLKNTFNCYKGGK